MELVSSILKISCLLTYYQVNKKKYGRKTGKKLSQKFPRKSLQKSSKNHPNNRQKNHHKIPQILAKTIAELH